MTRLRHGRLNTFAAQNHGSYRFELNECLRHEENKLMCSGHRLTGKPLLEADRDKHHGNGHWRLVFELIWAWRCPRPLCWKPLQEPALVRSAPASEIG